METRLFVTEFFFVSVLEDDVDYVYEAIAGKVLYD